MGGIESGDTVDRADVRFHYKPSSAWPPIPGDGISVRMPNGEDRMYDEQVQMYWWVSHPSLGPCTWLRLGLTV
jgi:hypothetical protein